MKLNTLIAIGSIGFVASTISAQTITGFGDSDFALAGGDFTVQTANPSNFSLSGSDAGSSFGGSITPSVEILSFSTKKLQLVATVTTNPSSNFTVELVDGNGNSAVYAGAWSSFTTGVSSTGDLLYVSDAGFDGTATLVLLSTGGSGATLAVSLDSLAAVPVVVPEPSTYASLAGVAVLGLVAYRRRRIAA